METLSKLGQRKASVLSSLTKRVVPIGKDRVRWG
jgi:hypothetical protein